MNVDAAGVGAEPVARQAPELLMLRVTLLRAAQAAKDDWDDMRWENDGVPREYEGDDPRLAPLEVDGNRMPRMIVADVNNQERYR